jgi:predicted DNA-binding transcriptional regulator YafY
MPMAKAAPATVAHMAAHCGCSRRQAQRYVAAAYQFLKADIDACNIDRPAQVAKLIHLLETACEQALSAKQFNAVVASCRELRELLGLAADR